MVIAYNTRRWARTNDPGNMRYCMIGFLTVILAILLIGPIRSFSRQVKILMRSNDDIEEKKLKDEKCDVKENGA